MYHAADGSDRSGGLASTSTVACLVRPPTTVHLAPESMHQSSKSSVLCLPNRQRIAMMPLPAAPRWGRRRLERQGWVLSPCGATRTIIGCLAGLHDGEPRGAASLLAAGGVPRSWLARLEKERWHRGQARRLGHIEGRQAGERSGVRPLPVAGPRPCACQAIRGCSSLTGSAGASSPGAPGPATAAAAHCRRRCRHRRYRFFLRAEGLQDWARVPHLPARHRGHQGLQGQRSHNEGAVRDGDAAQVRACWVLGGGWGGGGVLPPAVGNVQAHR